MTSDSPSPARPAGPPRLLIADDDEKLRAALASMFTSVGYEVFQAADGRTALELHQSRPADVVIAEMLLPRLDGIELLVRLLRDPSRPRVIAMTAGGEVPAELYLRTARHLGAAAVLAKPFQSGRLLRVVAEVLARK